MPSNHVIINSLEVFSLMLIDVWYSATFYSIDCLGFIDLIIPFFLKQWLSLNLWLRELSHLFYFPVFIVIWMPEILFIFRDSIELCNGKYVVWLGAYIFRNSCQLICFLASILDLFEYCPSEPSEQIQKHETFISTSSWISVIASVHLVSKSHPYL